MHTTNTHTHSNLLQWHIIFIYSDCRKQCAQKDGEKRKDEERRRSSSGRREKLFPSIFAKTIFAAKKNGTENSTTAMRTMTMTTAMPALNVTNLVSKLNGILNCIALHLTDSRCTVRMKVFISFHLIHCDWLSASEWAMNVHPTCSPVCIYNFCGIDLISQLNVNFE